MGKRIAEDVTYRGRRRWSGNHGKLWWDGELIFEISKFDCKVIANREDVIIGMSNDSKITSLTGQGTITIKAVVNRNLSRFLEEWKAGRDPRSTLVGVIDDPDAVEGQIERVSMDNCWFNELAIMLFEKGKVVEKEIPFGFTPEDATFIEEVA